MSNLLGLITTIILGLITPLKAGELYNESEISFQVKGQLVRGTLATPVGVKNAPVVLILVGMSGERHGAPIKNSNRTMFEYLAQDWAQNGIASLRISTAGKGGSEGNFKDMTLHLRVNEAVAAINWLVKQKRFDPTRVSILGHSQGTLVAAATAKKTMSANPLHAIVLWAPQVDALKTYKRSMGLTVFNQGISAKPNQIVSWKSSTARVRAFKQGFFKSLAKFNAVNDLRDFSGNLLIVTGKRDRFSPSGNAREFNTLPSNPDFSSFDVGHRMGAEQNLTAFKGVSTSTLNWLLAHN